MTILFLKDWRDSTGRPRAVVHKDTKNFSFIRMAVLLAKMGVKNNLFHLSLYDPKLLNVDPHALNHVNDPTGELRLRVAMECRRNIWYYLREVVRIPASGGDPIHFQLNRGNLSMVWCFMNSIDYNGTQPRQTGKAFENSTLIRTPNGWTQICDLSVGDAVVAADGSTTHVSGVYPQGKLQLYRVVFEDGRTLDCCAEHQWLVHNPKWDKSHINWRTVQTTDIIAHSKVFSKRKHQMSVPLIQPEKVDDVAVPLDPYLVGVFLSDYAFASDMVGVSTKYADVARHIRAQIPGMVTTQVLTEASVEITKAATPDPALKNALSELGILGTPKTALRIPTQYSALSPRQKLSLLQGILDISGSVYSPTKIRLNLASESLSLQLQELVWSLGGICTRTTVRAGKERSYYLTLTLPDVRYGFKASPERVKLVETPIEDQCKLRIVDVRPAEVAEATCIEVAHHQNLYVAERYVVSHNTIGAITLSSWVLYVNGYNMSMTMLTHSDKLVQENVKRLKDIRASLPPYMVMKSGDDIDNKQGLDYKALRNSYLTYIGQKDKQAANRVGRGSTSPSIHFDELAFIPNIRITFPAIMAATNRARVNAANAGMIHSNIYTTTAGDPSTDDGAFAHDLIKKAFAFTEKLYDCADIEAAQQMVSINSTIKLVNGTFSYLQLGYTTEWFKDTIARNATPPDEVQRDYLNNWVCMAKNPIIPKEVLDTMSQTRKPDPDFQEIIGDYVISWYVPEARVRSKSFREGLFFLGMDSSENIGRDFTTFVCIDPKTLSTIFTFRCNDSNTTKIGMLVARILNDFPRMLFIPERKNSGVFITDMVIMSMARAGQNPFTRIYNRIVQDRQYDEFRGVNLNDPHLYESTMRRYLGFMTTGTTRDVLYKQVLHRAASLARDRVYNPDLISELSGLQASNGRIDHRAGKHDDMVIAWLLACFVVFEGRNLELYGISKDELLKTIDYGYTDGVAQEKIEEQMMLREELKEVESKIRQANSNMVRNFLQQQKLRLEALIDPSVIMEPISVDAVSRDFKSYEVYTNVSSKVDRMNVNPQELFQAAQGNVPDARNTGVLWTPKY